MTRSISSGSRPISSAASRATGSVARGGTCPPCSRRRAVPARWPRGSARGCDRARAAARRSGRGCRRGESPSPVAVAYAGIRPGAPSAQRRWRRPPPSRSRGRASWSRGCDATAAHPTTQPFVRGRAARIVGRGRVRRLATDSSPLRPRLARMGPGQCLMNRRDRRANPWRVEEGSDLELLRDRRDRLHRQAPGRGAASGRAPSTCSCAKARAARSTR